MIYIFVYDILRYHGTIDDSIRKPNYIYNEISSLCIRYSSIGEEEMTKWHIEEYGDDNSMS